MERIWWEKIPDALSFVTHITESLLEEKSIILQYSSRLPWRDTFVDIVKERVQQQNASKSFITVTNVDDPGKYLLEEYCKREKRTTFRPSIGYPRFFATSDDIILHQRYFWVEVNSQELLTKWCDFISEYSKLRSKDKDNAVFILEWVDPVVTSGRKGVITYSFDDYISEYDCVVFSTLAASEVREPDVIKNYLSVLAANVVGNDIELIAACVKNYKSFLQDPYSTILKIAEEEVRSDYSPYSFAKTPEEVAHAIWLAQIKTVYPAIEEYREKFIDRHRSEIKKCLPVTSSYGEIYIEPEDVEIGTLLFMTGENFYLPYEEYQELKRFKNARNDLSHLKNLSFDEVKQLF